MVILILVQADLGMKMDELVSVQLCLFLFKIQFFMHAFIYFI